MTRSLFRRGASGALASLAFLALAFPTAAQRPEYVFVLHGGAGTITRESLTPDLEREYREKLTEALVAGRDILAGGGSGLDAVEAAIRILEDSPLFNAGKGAVFTHDGKNELDASIMDGKSRQAGAVTGVSHVKNPISLARLVMEKSRHVMLSREGAEEFALEQGIELVPRDYFFTERRWESLQRAREREREERASTSLPDTRNLPDDRKLGTVGAVALDRSGNLAAGTSTGGTTNKRWGRIGDSPIIGAGTYADDRCAVSSTGTGEYFIRNVVAHDICARARYQGVPLEEAARAVIMEVLPPQGGDGGVIALDAEGNFTTPFNTEGMYRGWVVAGAEPVIEIYSDE
jgi:beta-aspartyl-peptidase (threonine type)